jgi:uncharacterized membrane protein YwzB
MVVFAAFAVVHAVLFFVNLGAGQWGYLSITLIQFVLEVRLTFARLLLMGAVCPTFSTALAL